MGGDTDGVDDTKDGTKDNTKAGQTATPQSPPDEDDYSSTPYASGTDLSAVLEDTLGLSSSQAHGLVVVMLLAVTVVIITCIYRVIANCLCGNGGTDEGNNGSKQVKSSGEISLTSTNYSPVATDLDADMDDDDWGDPFDGDWGDDATSTHRLTAGLEGSHDKDGGSNDDSVPFGGDKGKAVLSNIGAGRGDIASFSQNADPSISSN